MRRRCLLAAGWGAVAAAARAAGPEPPLTVFAAASLTEVLPAIVRAAGLPLPRISFAASSTLARQIEHGAPADLFLSADEAWIAHLRRRGVLPPAAPVAAFAGNRLVAVRPGGGPPSEAESMPALREALAVERVVIGDPAHVPAGRYARAALQALGLWAQTAPRLVHADNVRTALAFVERGEAQAGIVYASDARLSRRVRAVARFPRASHPPIRYPAALLAPDKPAARALHAALFTPLARTLLEQAGFEPLDGEPPVSR